MMGRVGFPINGYWWDHRIMDASLQIDVRIHVCIVCGVFQADLGVMMCF